MKELFRNAIHKEGRSHDSLIAEIKGKKVKMTYDAHNATESCNIEFFDGNKWNHILSMLDMGIEPTKSAYIWDEKKRKSRADECFKKADIICKAIIS